MPKKIKKSTRRSRIFLRIEVVDNGYIICTKEGKEAFVHDFGNERAIAKCQAYILNCVRFEMETHDRTSKHSTYRTKVSVLDFNGKEVDL
jgi:hypothetical protein